MILGTDEIRKFLLEEELTAYSVAKATGLRPNSIDNIKRGDVTQARRDTRERLTSFILKMRGEKPKASPRIVPVPIITKAEVKGYLTMGTDVSVKEYVFLDMADAATMMAFRITGNSMNSRSENALIDGDIVVGQRIDRELNHFEIQDKFYILMSDTDYYCRLVKNITDEGYTCGVLYDGISDHLIPKEIIEAVFQIELCQRVPRR